MNKSNKIPLLWQTLANKYRDDIDFGSHRDRKGKSSVKLGFPAGEDGQSKVLIYPAGSTKAILYKGESHMSLLFKALMTSLFRNNETRLPH